MMGSDCCGHCGYEGVACKQFNDPDTWRGDEAASIWLCELCANTYTGRYSMDLVRLHKAVCWVANRLLTEIWSLKP